MRDIFFKFGFGLVVLSSLALIGCGASGSASTPIAQSAATPQPGAASPQPTSSGKVNSVDIQWLGQSAFLLTSSTGTRLLIDPFNSSVGYTVPKLDNVDAVLVTHEHADHNNVAMASGTPKVIRGLQGNNVATVDEQVKDVHIRNVASSHGEGRGNNSIFVLDMAGLEIVHLGDLGYTLTPTQVQQIGPVDVLMMPVGGFYTIGPDEATIVIQQLSPKTVIPMHYKTAKSQPNWPGGPVDPFLEGKRVERVGKTTLTVDKTSLPATATVFLLNYE